MGQNINVAPFRINLLHSTGPTVNTAQVPLIVTMPPMCSSLLEIVMYTNTLPDATKTGWRLRNAGSLIIPTNGSGEGGFTPGANENNWATLPFTHSSMDLYDMKLVDPTRVTLEFYNVTAATDIVVGGFLLSRDTVFGIDDLVKSLDRLAAHTHNIVFPAHTHAEKD